MRGIGFVMMPSYYEALRPLPDDQRLQMYDALLDYAFAGKEPEGLSPVLNGYFTLLRPNLDNSIRHYAASVENGKKGGRPRSKPNKNPEQTQQKPSGNRDKDKDMDKDMENTMADKPPAPAPKSKKFIPPTVEQVAAYIRERGSGVDARRFVDFYTSKDWMVGKNKMNDWQAAVRTWEQRDVKKAPAERDYTAPPGFDFLEG